MKWDNKKINEKFLFLKFRLKPFRGESGEYQGPRIYLAAWEPASKITFFLLAASKTPWLPGILDPKSSPYSRALGLPDHMSDMNFQISKTQH